MPVSATQSSTFAGDEKQFGAGNCIDGVYHIDHFYQVDKRNKGVVRDGTDPASVDGTGNGIRSMCHTDGEATPWIALDFGGSVTIQGVEIFNRPFYGSRTRNVVVRISDELPTSGSQMFSGGSLLGHFAGPATDGQHIVISGEKHL